MTSSEAQSSSRPAPSVPTSPTLEGLEDKWQQVWEEQEVYRFTPPATRDEVFSIDTPPPTVSGSLHVGHIFSYTHTDVIARYQRMQGKEVFYPMGWDDNGLPTERRVQNFFGVRCDPSVPYDEAFTPPAKPDPKRAVPISRRNFIELCHQLTAVDEQAFENLWRRVGLSVDWTQLYATISDSSQRTSQRAFLRNYPRGEAYLSEAPTMWDVTFQTAVAQAELEARDYPGAYHRVAFHGADGPVYIETTRPELIVSVVALIAHPSDERYQHLFGTTVTSPVFGVEIPVLAHRAAEPDKGAGIAMCCTFGDLTDVQWWRELNLPTRTVITRDGRLSRDTPDWLVNAAPYADLAGKTAFSAREAMVAKLRESGDLDGDPTPTQRKANFYERGEKPLEIVSTRQWYIRNGGRDENLRSELLERGDELAWVPAHMRHRYENWVNGLNGDWLISRQRFFGVPFPVWYRLDEEGDPVYDAPILPSEDALPVDPQSQVPDAFTEEQRGIPGGFVGDPDIMDTWATSSLTPQIACGWETNPDLFDLTFPMDLAPQAHDIIRTWLFSRVVRSHFEHHQLPWKRATISGFVTDPDRKKMSKSKGNTVVPTAILDRFGADAVRWRAAMARPGMDSPFDEAQMKVGRRLAMKVLNASRFVLTACGSDSSGDITSPADLAMLSELRLTVEAATAAFESFDYTTALETAERNFWTFCDDYVELVKERAYGGQGEQAAASARAALLGALDVQLRLLAPFLPFVTEEVWSWFRAGSIHRAAWPTVDEISDTGDPALLGDVSTALGELRGAKSVAKVSMKTPIAAAEFVGPADILTRLAGIEPDLRAVGHIVGEITWTPGGDHLTVQVTMAPEE